MTNMRLLDIGPFVPAVLLVMLGVLVPGPASSREDHGGNFFRATLQGVEEVPVDIYSGTRQIPSGNH